MRGSQQPDGDTTGPSAERAAEVTEVITRVTRWSATRSEVTALLLVGSYARNAARPDSDVDLVLLTTDPPRYLTPDRTHHPDQRTFPADDPWAGELVLGTPTRVRSWGAVTERRFITPSGLEIEINIGSPSWAAVDPVDPGTRRVVTDGARPLHDPTGALADLLQSCRLPADHP